MNDRSAACVFAKPEKCGLKESPSPHDGHAPALWQDTGRPELVGDGDIDPKTLWKEHVRLVAWEKGFLPLVHRKMASYPAPKEAHGLKKESRLNDQSACCWFPRRRGEVARRLSVFKSPATWLARHPRTQRYTRRSTKANKKRCPAHSNLTRSGS